MITSPKLKPGRKGGPSVSSRPAADTPHSVDSILREAYRTHSRNRLTLLAMECVLSGGGSGAQTGERELGEEGSPDDEKCD